MAERQPGELSAQTLNAMRAQLLSEIGSEDKPGSLKGVAVAYFRQALLRKSSGPMQRELLTLAAGVCCLLNGKVAAATDIFLQRFKSCEAVLGGSHYTVAQRLELIPQEGVSVTPLPELTAAQREVYQEARAKQQASHPDGKPYKGGGKSKSDTKDDRPKGGGKNPRGKGQGGKFDGNKKAKGDGAE